MKVISEHPYRSQRVALLTQHGKQDVIAPALHSAVACNVERVAGIDTDLLGTFTREIPRAGTQREAARHKARLGMARAGLPLGIASEGAFGPDPMMGMLPWNVELLVWIDNVRGIEVTASAQGAANFAHLKTDDWDAVQQFAQQWRFPDHHLVMRPEQDGDPRIRKGVASWPALEAAFHWAQQRSSTALVFIETDMRADANPTRMQAIQRAALELGQRLASLCPACDMPGFWIVRHVPGLPCGRCGEPTQAVIADVLACVQCDHHIERQRADVRVADPAHCDFCNP